MSLHRRMHVPSACQTRNTFFHDHEVPSQRFDRRIEFQDDFLFGVQDVDNFIFHGGCFEVELFEISVEGVLQQFEVVDEVVLNPHQVLPECPLQLN